MRSATINLAIFVSFVLGVLHKIRVFFVEKNLLTFQYSQQQKYNDTRMPVPSAEFR